MAELWKQRTFNFPSSNPQMTLDRSGNLSVAGTMSSSTAPTAADHLTNKAYVDSKVVPGNNQSLNTTDTATFAGLKLGAGSTLSHFEEMLWSTSFTGPYNTPSYTFMLSRIGRTINVTLLSGFSGSITNGAAQFESVSMLPSQFRPGSESQNFGPYSGVTIINASGPQNSAGYAHISYEGKITIRTYSATGAFNASGMAGVRPFTLSFVIYLP